MGEELTYPHRFADHPPGTYFKRCYEGVECYGIIRDRTGTYNGYGVYTCTILWHKDDKNGIECPFQSNVVSGPGFYLADKAEIVLYTRGIL